MPRWSFPASLKQQHHLVDPDYIHDINTVYRYFLKDGGYLEIPNARLYFIVAQLQHQGRYARPDLTIAYSLSPTIPSYIFS